MPSNRRQVNIVEAIWTNNACLSFRKNLAPCRQRFEVPDPVGKQPSQNRLNVALLKSGLGTAVRMTAITFDLCHVLLGSISAVVTAISGFVLCRACTHIVLTLFVCHTSSFISDTSFVTAIRLHPRRPQDLCPSQFPLKRSILKIEASEIDATTPDGNRGIVPKCPAECMGHLIDSRD